MSRTRTLVLLGMAAAATLAIVSFIPVGVSEKGSSTMQVPTIDLSKLPADPPARQLRLLFIHHSCGGQWLAPLGDNKGESCIYETATNGGLLRDRLRENNYEVHEASYDSQIGDKTDIFDWPAKFRDHMQQVLTCDRQDTFYQDGRQNEIVMFKSCFPNSVFVGQGTAPGDPDGPALTVENAKAAYRALLPEFQKQPGVLFVAVTAPPVVAPSVPLVKWVIKRLLGKPSLAASGPLARQFNNWLKDSKTGWLSEYPGTNVVVFDLYDVLTDLGASDFSRYPSGPEQDDNHPASAGNQKATELFVPFLNRAVRRAGLDKPPAAAEEDR